MTTPTEAPVGPLCPSCGAANPASSRFCNSCGARLDALAPREERKLVSILFVDLVGFTARSDQADPEDVREALQLYHAEAKRRIEEYGGVVEKFIGDAVMAVFGAPVAHGDDAERAVRAGLRVLDAIGGLNGEQGLDLAARAAVATGEAVVSLDSGRGEALAMGDVVNTASRLQTAAPEGQLLVGSETYRATRGAIAYEAQEPIAAKGKADPVEAWLAVAPIGGPAERVLRDTPLLGRSHELALMQSAWRRCAGELRPQLVTVLGPPGIGKSRLCRDFSSLVAEEGGRIVRGRCLPYEEQVGYQAFSRLVQSACGILGSDPTAVARQKLDDAVAALMPPAEASETSRYVALLVGLAPDAEVPDPQLLFFAARRLLECMGLEQPTIFVFEDIHWAQASEIALLEYLARYLRDSAVMLVAAARPELMDVHPSWGSGLTAQTTIPLDPLSPQDAADLAAVLVPSRDGTAPDVTKIVETAAGNPLFLEELAAAVTERNTQEDLPVTVREAIAARIDALPANARTALLAAAVVGRTFWRGVVLALDGIDDIDAACATLESRDLIRRDASSQLADDPQFTFKHMLIREVAYATLPRAVRRERHAAVAGYMEETLAGAAETVPTILAHHWREAGEPTRAIPYLVSAADAARRSWAQGTVIELYSTAVDLAPDERTQAHLRLQRAVALVELGDYERAAEELTGLVPSLERQEKLDALIALGHALLWTERDQDTLATAAAARAMLAEVDDASAEAAVLAMESQALAMRGADGDIERALRLGDLALKRWVPDSRPFDLVQHLHLHADATYWVGQYERSLELSRRTRALASEEHVAESLLRGGGFEALALCELGRHEEAIAIFDEMLVVARDIGRTPQTVLNYSSLAYRELNDLDEARRRTENALELSASGTFGMPRQFAGSDLIFTQLLAGDVGGAQAAWSSRWEDVQHATAWTTWLVAGRLAAARAEIALHAETPEAAAEWAQTSLEIARRTKRRKYEARSLTLLGHALARLRRGDEALDALRAAVVIVDDLVGAPARWEARAALGEVAYSLGQDDVAATAVNDAADLIQGFLPTLAPGRASTLRTSPIVAQTLSSAGRSAVA